MIHPLPPPDDESFDALLRQVIQRELDRIPVPPATWPALLARLRQVQPVPPEEHDPALSGFPAHGLFSTEAYE
jgi:hypothetical protein